MKKLEYNLGCTQDIHSKYVVLFFFFFYFYMVKKLGALNWVQLKLYLIIVIYIYVKNRDINKLFRIIYTPNRNKYKNSRAK